MNDNEDLLYRVVHGGLVYAEALRAAPHEREVCVIDALERERFGRIRGPAQCLREGLRLRDDGRSSHEDLTVSGGGHGIPLQKEQLGADCTPNAERPWPVHGAVPLHDEARTRHGHDSVDVCAHRKPPAERYTE